MRSSFTSQTALHVAVNLAKQGKLVRVMAVDMDIVLEPGTGNLHSVALASPCEGQDVGWVSFDELSEDQPNS